MQLTSNFKSTEFEFSHTALKHGIDNSIPVRHWGAVCLTAQRLQAFRDWLSDKYEEDTPITILSGYRSKALNKRISGSSKTSDHMTGFAADIRVAGFSNHELMIQIIEWLTKEGIQFDQLIDEYGSWVHISFAPANRGQILEATMVRKMSGQRKTVYRLVA